MSNPLIFGTSNTATPVKSFFLRKIVQWIVGGDIFNKIKDLVMMYLEDNSISGSEKRDKVISEARELGLDIADWALNLAIEAALVWIKTKTGGPVSSLEIFKLP